MTTDPALIWLEAFLEGTTYDGGPENAAEAARNKNPYRDRA